MKVWFLRIKHPRINRRLIKAAGLAPILFRKVPISNLRVDMDEAEIAAVTNKVYHKESLRARRQYAGTLRRFLTDVEVRDFVGIRVNRDAKMLFGRFMKGHLRSFPGFEKEGIKGRPFQPLSRNEEADLLKAGLPESVKSYIGTFCNWLDETNEARDSADEEIDLPDASEKERRRFYSAKPADARRQVKFIRVGADLGCGHRLSRIFPGNYYHFIPIPQHNDPEFCRFTYGDIAARKGNKAATKGRSLMNLRRGDMLVFYAGFDPEDKAPLKRLVGIFAFFIVKEAFVFVPAKAKALRFSDQSRDFDPFKEFAKADPKRSTQEWNELTLRYGNWNQHFADLTSKRMDVIICADRKRSKLLSKVEVLEAFDRDSRQYVVGKMTAQKWGLTEGHDLRMSPVRTVDPQLAEMVFDRLDKLDS